MILSHTLYDFVPYAMRTAPMALSSSPEDHPLHMTGFLRQLSHDEILPATVHREGHHGVPHGEPVGAAHQLIAWEIGWKMDGFAFWMWKTCEEIGEKWVGHREKKAIQCI